MKDPEAVFGDILSLLETVKQADEHRVIDCTDAPVLTTLAYASAESANNAAISKKIVLNANLPWRTWFLTGEGAHLMGEYDCLEAAHAAMQVSYLMLRLSGPVYLG